MLAIPQENQRQVVDPSQNIGPEPEDGEEESRLLLRFAAPRDPVMIAKWIKFQILDTERQDWTRSYNPGSTSNGRAPCTCPTNTPKAPTHWAGGCPTREGRTEPGPCPTRADELEELRMVWDTADTAFAENLAAARAYYAEAGTLAAPRHAVALDKPVGQWLTNLRRPGGLGKDPERAARRAQQLAAIDPHWNPGQLGWTVDWQRH